MPCWLPLTLCHMFICLKLAVINAWLNATICKSYMATVVIPAMCVTAIVFQVHLETAEV